jgi:hypothetical protein
MTFSDAVNIAVYVSVSLVDDLGCFDPPYLQLPDRYSDLETSCWYAKMSVDVVMHEIAAYLTDDEGD